MFRFPSKTRLFILRFLLDGQNRHLSLHIFLEILSLALSQKQQANRRRDNACRHPYAQASPLGARERRFNFPRHFPGGLEPVFHLKRQTLL